MHNMVSMCQTIDIQLTQSLLTELIHGEVIMQQVSFPSIRHQYFVHYIYALCSTSIT